MLSPLLDQLKTSEAYADQVVHHEVIPAQKARYGEPSEPLPDELTAALARLGIERLYTHQVEALEAVRAGQNVAVVTPTASGKTLVYNLPVLEAALADETTKALYLFPLKALEQDQQKVFEELVAAVPGDPAVSAAIYDGDTPGWRRRKITASPPSVLVTNPDMLHLGILAHHANWETYFRDLRFVVIDELHTYRGVFGSHVAQLMRRLHRICAHYGASPQFITTSATTAEPRQLVETLVGRPFTVVAESGAPQSTRHVIFINPTASPYTLAARLFADCLKAGLKTIVFTKARKITELIHMWTAEREPTLARKISSYRAGFLPEERREIEGKLFSGELWGVVSTSALEMGIDVGGLDACVLVGYPGTIMSTWQRSGRVGRAERESLVVLVAQADALDQYFMRHPEDFFQRGFERAVVDPANVPILRAHLPCAAAEVPLADDDPAFPPPGELAEHTEALGQAGELLRAVADGCWHAVRRRPHRFVDIRAAGESFTILEEPGREVIGTVSGPRAYGEGHEGAVYLHRGRQYEVVRFDQANRNIFARSADVAYYTQPLQAKETTILETTDRRPAGHFVVNRGRLLVTQRVTGYEKRRIAGQDLLSTHELDMPEVTFETVGFWIEVEEAVRRLVEGPTQEFMGGLHAVEHAAIALFPLFAMCDRHDIGGICYTMHPEVGKAAIFIYDGYEGGVGLAERVYDEVEDLLRATLKLLLECPCLEGCPSCIHSPKCGSGNRPLSKEAAVLILKALLGEVDLGRAETLRATAEEGDETWSPVVAAEPERADPAPRLVFFDLETQRSAEEVGGWANKHLMRLAVGVAYDTAEEAFFTYYEDQASELIDHLERADLVVGFNIVRFDYEVLRAYSPVDFSTFLTFDILQDIYRRLGFRLPLAELVRHTLGRDKTADGLQSLAWFKEGRLDLVTEYCTDDVALTRDLFLHGLNQGHLRFEREGAGVVQILVDWSLEEMLAIK
ncbi:MAG: DEAD/DEAH box helicase [bacterium]|nr:DEAD/DEAH box helicase [bacterium]